MHSNAQTNTYTSEFSRKFFHSNRNIVLHNNLFRRNWNTKRNKSEFTLETSGYCLLRCIVWCIRRKTSLADKKKMWIVNSSICFHAATCNFYRIFCFKSIISPDIFIHCSKDARCLETHNERNAIRRSGHWIENHVWFKRNPRVDIELVQYSFWLNVQYQWWVLLSYE